MPRIFNKRQVELMAPAGTLEIFKKVIKSNTDAVYLGGKKLNMRMHRKDFNLNDEELAEAVSIAHSMGKKVYVTANNLHSQEDLEHLIPFLLYIEKINVDAIIVQDVSIISLVNSMGLNIQMHSSVMMDVHNLETVKFLKEQGISRIVVSRETPLCDVKYFKANVDMEFEYFVHGDMCIAHGSQCTYSGIIFGQSSNRGRCMKPCRWDYKIKYCGDTYNTEYPIAVRDMYMYESIPELIECGVTALKIEGRMRDAEYITNLVEAYGDAIDRYIDDPISYSRKKDADELFENRKRDFTTFYAFGKNENIINRRLEGTGAFYSTGKVFSTPVEERAIDGERIEKLNKQLESEAVENNAIPELCVKVNDIKSAEICIELGVKNIYLSGNVFLPEKAFTKSSIQKLTAQKGKSKIYISLPHMMKDISFNEYSQLLSYDLGIDGLLVTNMGAAACFKDYELIGDTTLNVYNDKAVEFYKNMGMSAVSLSMEMPLAEVISTVKNLKGSVQTELIVHGAPVVMLLEEDLFINVDASKKEDGLLSLSLVDDIGIEHPVYKDSAGRNHMTMSKDICYIDLLKGLHGIGLNRFRIEGCHYNERQLREVVTAYINAMRFEDEMTASLSGSFTLGAFDF